MPRLSKAPRMSMGEALMKGDPVVLRSGRKGSVPGVVCGEGREKDALELLEKLGLIRIMRPQLMSPVPGPGPG